MKLAVFSDIHGNIWGLKEALRLLEGYSFDSNVLQAEVEKAVPGIPVIDVRK